MISFFISSYDEACLVVLEKARIFGHKGRKAKMQKLPKIAKKKPKARADSNWPVMASNWKYKLNIK